MTVVQSTTRSHLASDPTGSFPGVLPDKIVPDTMSRINVRLIQTIKLSDKIVPDTMSRIAEIRPPSVFYMARNLHQVASQ